jgi:hypothetical protein
VQEEDDFAGGGQATEGHRIREDFGPALAERADVRDAARKRVFFQLDSERRTLAARSGPRWRPFRRYEELTLATMLARLERGWLSARSDEPVGGDGDQSAYELARWADPWGTAPRMKLDADLEHLDEALSRLGRWLPPGAAAKAHDKAQGRLDAITAQLLQRDPHAWTATDVGASAAGKVREAGRSSRARFAALAALLLLAAGLGGFLLAFGDSGGSDERPGSPSIAKTLRDRSGAPEAQTQAPGRAAKDGRGDARGSDERRPVSGGGAGGQRDRGASAAPSQAAPPVVVPVPVEQPPPATTPSPASPPAPGGTGAPSSSSTERADEAPSCPPEFGYEC